MPAARASQPLGTDHDSLILSLDVACHVALVAEYTRPRLSSCQTISLRVVRELSIPRSIMNLQTAYLAQFIILFITVSRIALARLANGELATMEFLTSSVQAQVRSCSAAAARSSTDMSTAQG